ncbi:hypothetical protein ACQP2X_37105 [Actinoplanes sp. CA-131856]
MAAPDRRRGRRRSVDSRLHPAPTSRSVPRPTGVPGIADILDLPGVPHSLNLPGVPHFPNLTGLPEALDLVAVPDLNAVFDLVAVSDLGAVPDLDAASHLDAISHLNDISHLDAISDLGAVPEFFDLTEPSGVADCAHLAAAHRAGQDVARSLEPLVHRGVGPHLIRRKEAGKTNRRADAGLRARHERESRLDRKPSELVFLSCLLVGWRREGARRQSNTGPDRDQRT